ncbi:MAG TPA: peptide-N-glycosidase F-related protein [Polyangiaceae bacterium]|nr:peptide-N-glycosidase F-related protein [Polyangiaceae bacterium]
MKYASLVPALLAALGCASEPLKQPKGDQPVTGSRTLSVFERVRVSSDDQAEYVRNAIAEVDFGADSVSRAVLKVELESPCFPFAGWQELEMPEGHNWPLTCDAFDRLLSVSLDEPAEGSDGPPGLELVRAVTPFGGPLSISSDVTDVVNGLPGTHQLKIAIDTWGDAEGRVTGAKGEWIVSISLELELGAPLRRVLAVRPLFLGSQTEPDSPALAFTAPEGASEGRIEYRATGHGLAEDSTCIGPAEEFCSRTHSLLLDGAVLDEFEAWRTDCAAYCTPAHDDTFDRDYCAENPCGAAQSVRAPRANWCPGTVSAPRVLEGTGLAVAGEHELATTISELKEGGNWRVSLTYFAFE